MEEALFWSLLGLGTSSVLTSWFMRAFGLGRKEAHHGFAHGASDPPYLKPEDQDWMGPSWPLRPSFWVKLGVILLVAASIVSAVAKLIEAISSFVN